MVTRRYNETMQNIGVSVYTNDAFASLSELQEPQNRDAYETFILQLYWVGVSESPSNGGCGVTAPATFTSKSEFYSQFIDEQCPTIDAASGTCDFDGACACEDNNFGITPYAGRPSFYNNDDLEDAVNGTCYMWDNGLALPAVPKNLVLGQPVGSESIEAWEFVLFTESADSLAFEMARRPHDPHDISVDDAQNILDIWLTKFNQDIPYVHRSDDFSLSLSLSLMSK